MEELERFSLTNQNHLIDNEECESSIAAQSSICESDLEYT